MSELLGKRAPDFSLPMVGGGRFRLEDTHGHILVINFWSAECRWSRRADVVLVYRQLTWAPRGVQIVGIVSNAGEVDTDVFPEAQRRSVKYPLLLDAGNIVADSFRATITPQFFVLDPKGFIRYAGALDDGTDQRPRATTIYVDRAVSALLAGQSPDPAQTKPYGCALTRRSTATSVQSARA